jgi:hypothetical protein
MTSSPVCWKQIMKMFYSIKIDELCSSSIFYRDNLWSIPFICEDEEQHGGGTKEENQTVWSSGLCHLVSAYQSFRGNLCLYLHLPSALEIGSAGSSKTLVSTCKTENKNFHCCGNLRSQKNEWNTETIQDAIGSTTVPTRWILSYTPQIQIYWILQFLDMHDWEDMKDMVFLHSFHIKEREGYGTIMLMSSFILTEFLRSPVQAMIP